MVEHRLNFFLLYLSQSLREGGVNGLFQPGPTVIRGPTTDYKKAKKNLTKVLFFYFLNNFKKLKF